MTVQEMKGITMPEAPIVWQAVAYAELRLQHARKSGHPVQEEKRAKVMAERIIEWLVVRGYDDLAVIVQFGLEIEALESAVNRLIKGAVGIYPPHDFYPWLLLQGRTIHDAVVVTPTLYNVLQLHPYGLEIDMADDAMERIFSAAPMQGGRFLEAFQRLIRGGAHPDDFRDWDMATAHEKFGARHDGDEEEDEEDTEC